MIIGKRNGTILVITCVTFALIQLIIIYGVSFSGVKKHIKLSWKTEFDIIFEDHPVFRTYNISRVYRERKRVTVLIIVSSAPKRSDRRESIRKTWWKECVPKNEVWSDLLFLAFSERNLSEFRSLLSMTPIEFPKIFTIFH